MDSSSSRKSMDLPAIPHSWETFDHRGNFPPSPTTDSQYPLSSPYAYNKHQLPSAGAASVPFLSMPSHVPKAYGHDNELERYTSRQSLPSIHEALGSEPPRSHPSITALPPALSATPKHHPPSSAPSSPAEPPTRNHSTDFNSLPSSASSFSYPRSPFLPGPTSQAPLPPPPPPPPPPPFQALTEPSSHASLATSPQNTKLPSLRPLNTIRSPPANTNRSNERYSSYPPPPPPLPPPPPPPPPPAYHDAPAPQSATSITHPYSYPHHSPTYPSSARSKDARSPSYSSPLTHTAPSHHSASPWRDDPGAATPESKKINQTKLAAYGESVKRHLESFDMEASLNEMADSAGHVAEFSKVYRRRSHESQRVGIIPQAMPHLVEVDDMLKQNERIRMSLHRIRDVVLNHRQASFVEPSRDSFRQSTRYDSDLANNYNDDAKGGGGFANGDSKMRKRGRAAPPGRCHSCNRAETPEWRRGPDGARTLCNACGLHYAKLNRKMGNKQAAGSMLRPKAILENMASPG